MAVWSFANSVVLEYDLVLVRDVSVCVKDDRDTNASECLVVAANMVA